MTKSLAATSAVFHRHQGALLLAQVGHGLVDVLVLDLDLGFFHRDAGEGGERHLGLDFDFEAVAERTGVGQGGDGFVVGEGGLAEHLQVVLLDGLAVAFGDEGAADLLLDVGAEAFLDQLRRGVPGAETGQGGVAAEFFELLGELGLDAVFGDLDRDLLHGRARVFDGDGVEKLGLAVEHGGGLFLILGHGNLCTDCAVAPGKCPGDCLMPVHQPRIYGKVADGSGCGGV